MGPKELWNSYTYTHKLSLSSSISVSHYSKICRWHTALPPPSTNWLTSETVSMTLNPGSSSVKLFLFWITALCLLCKSTLRVIFDSALKFDMQINQVGKVRLCNLQTQTDPPTLFTAQSALSCLQQDQECEHLSTVFASSHWLSTGLI